MSSPVTADSAASRKRLVPSAPVYSPNETLNQMTQEAEARQQDKYAVQKEIRAIRAQEMEKQRKQDEEKERDREEAMSRFNRTPTNGTTSQASPHSLSHVAGKPPRAYQPSTTPTSMTPSRFDETENPRELKKKLLEMEEKYKKHAIFQTQFENDNQKLLYEVDLLKDLLEEHEELIIELRRQFKDKSRELDYQKRSYKDLQTDFARLKEILKQRDTLIEDSGLVLYTDSENKKKQEQSVTNGSNSKKSNQSQSNQQQSNQNQSETDNEIKSVLPAALVAPETAKLLDMLGEGTIDDKLRRLIYEKQELKEQNSRLRIDIEDERNKITQLEKKILLNSTKEQDNQDSTQDLHEMQRQYTKEINDLKMKLQKIEHENIVIKQDKQRLDTQLKYLQTNFDELEQTERRLIKEKRETQRELNDSKMQVNDLQLKLEVLQKTLEKKRQTIKFVDTTTGSLSSFHSPTASAIAPTTTTPLASQASNNNPASNSTSTTPTPSLMTTPTTNSTSTHSLMHQQTSIYFTNGDKQQSSIEASRYVGQSTNMTTVTSENCSNGSLASHQVKSESSSPVVSSFSNSNSSGSSGSSSTNTSPQQHHQQQQSQQPIQHIDRERDLDVKQKNLINEFVQVTQAPCDQFNSLKLDGN